MFACWRVCIPTNQTNNLSISNSVQVCMLLFFKPNQITMSIIYASFTYHHSTSKLLATKTWKAYLLSPAGTGNFYYLSGLKKQTKQNHTPLNEAANKKKNACRCNLKQNKGNLMEHRWLPTRLSSLCPLPSCLHIVPVRSVFLKDGGVLRVDSLRGKSTEERREKKNPSTWFRHYSAESPGSRFPDGVRW